MQYVRDVDSKLKEYGEITENCTNSRDPGKLKFAEQFWGCNGSNVIYKILGALFVIFECKMISL